MASVLTPVIEYPDSDGQPMSENTEQYRWIVTICEGLDTQYANDPNVFVAADLLWYPVQGHPEIRQAPDTLVALGRPKGRRGSYQQWLEGDLAPQVVFEILSPGNRKGEMDDKFVFYERYGVEEYYIYDPDRLRLEGWRRSKGKLIPIEKMHNWASPLLGIRFEMTVDGLVLYHPDGERFVLLHEETARRKEAEAKQQEATKARLLAEAKQGKETKARKLAEAKQEEETKARILAEAKHEKTAAEKAAAEALLEKLRARLRELGEEPQ
jgi:Uma2 family endonuclease